MSPFSLSCFRTIIRHEKSFAQVFLLSLFIYLFIYFYFLVTMRSYHSNFFSQTKRRSTIWFGVKFHSPQMQEGSTFRKYTIDVHIIATPDMQNMIHVVANLSQNNSLVSLNPWSLTHREISPELGLFRMRTNDAMKPFCNNFSDTQMDQSWFVLGVERKSGRSFLLHVRHSGVYRAHNEF